MFNTILTLAFIATCIYIFIQLFLIARKSKNLTKRLLEIKKEETDIK
jgi:predicted membrane protein